MCAKKKPAMLEPDMQDAVIYTRYSSHNQRDCSIEQQVADCEIFARQNNLHQHKSHLKTYVFQVAFAISAIPAILLRQIRQDIRPQSLLLPQGIKAAVQIHFVDRGKNGAAQQQTLVVERGLRLGCLAAEHHGKTSL